MISLTHYILDAVVGPHAPRVYVKSWHVWTGQWPVREIKGVTICVADNIFA